MAVSLVSAVYLQGCIILLLSHLGHCQTSTPYAATDVGVFQGMEGTSPFEGNPKYYSFLGIPFAKPPVGNLRWQKPEPSERVDSVYEATNYKAACPQTSAGTHPTSEDCLYLDVYLPNSVNGLYFNSTEAQEAAANPGGSPVPAGDLLPVLVWVHGGGYFLGYGAQYPSFKLATQQNIVVVVIQYRLNIMGFISSGDDALPGNYGLWDQRLAIKWVKDNIRAFGGDPSNITISGESAGSGSVSQQSLSRHSSGLFQKVIMMSGAAGAAWTTNRDPMTTFHTLANVTGCAGPTKRMTDEIIACLREKSEAELQQASAAMGEEAGFVPVVDGDFLPDTAENLLKDEDYLTSIGFSDYTFLNGVVNNEGAVNYFSILAALPYLLTTDTVAADHTGVITDLLLRYTFGEYSADLKDVVNFHYFNSFDSRVPLKTVLDAMADALFVVPALNFAGRYGDQASSSFRSPTTYMYLFDYYPSFTAGTPFEGVFHGLDLSYMFGLSDAAFSVYGVYQLNGTLEPQDYAMSDGFGNMIGGFVRTGDPNNGLPAGIQGTWPPYDVTNEPYLRINLSPTVENHMFKSRVSLWTDLVPRLHSRWLMETSSPTTPGATTPGATTEPTFSKFSLTESEADSVITALIVVCVVLGCICLLAVVYIVMKSRNSSRKYTTG